MLNQEHSYRPREGWVCTDGEVEPRRPPKPEPSIANVTMLDGSPFKPESDGVLVRLSGGRWVTYRIR